MPRKKIAVQRIHPGKAGYIRIDLLTNARMVGSEHKRPHRVIVNGVIRDWVGFSWTYGPDATQRDADSYPVALYPTDPVPDGAAEWAPDITPDLILHG